MSVAGELIGRYRVLGLFVLVYMVVFGIAALVQHNAEFVYYTAVMMVLIGCVIVIDRRVGFSPVVLWGLALWGLAHMGGGTVHIHGPDGPMVPYNFRPSPDLPRYDQVVHAVGFGITTLACWEGLAAMVGGSPRARIQPTLGLVLAAMLMSMGLGALNELIEFTATRILEQTNIGGYVNTGWDLVSNQVGILVVGVVLLVRGQRSSGNTADRRSIR